MTCLTCSLAADTNGTWRVVFLPEELHLYVEFGPKSVQIRSTG